MTKADALGTPVPVVYDGETYEIPPALAWDLDVLEAWEAGKILAAVKALLGSDGWARYRAKPRTVGDLSALFEAIQEAIGAGN